MSRRRRWPRRVAAVTAALVAVAALRIVLGKTLGDWVAERERARFERDVGSLDPARLAAPELSEADNSVPAIVAAVATIQLSDRDRRLLDCSSRCAALDAERGAELDELLLRQRASLAALHRASQRPDSSFGPRHELFHGRRVDVTPWLTASRLVAVDGERGLATGDLARLDAAIDTLHGMTLALRREPITVFAILGDAVERFELDLIRQQLDATTERATLTALAQRVEELARLPSGFEVLHGEAVFALDMLRRTPVVPRPSGSARERIEALVWPWSEGHIEAGQLAGMRDLLGFAQRPQVEWPPTEAILAARPGRLRAWLDPTAPFDLFGPWLFPNLLEIVRKAQQLESAEQLASLAIEIALSREANGSLPESLVDFPALRPDAVAGELPVYRLDGDGSATLELTTARRLLERELAAAAEGQEPSWSRRLRATRWRIPPATTRSASKSPTLALQETP